MKIFYTSDIHGYYFPTDYNDGKRKPFGLLGILDKYATQDSILIDGGDILQGSSFSYYRSIEKDSVTAANIMNKLGYDFVTLGNHDFNYGYEFLRDYVNNLNAHVICCNVVDLKKEILNIRDYEIIEKDGKKIGIIGAVTDWVNIWEKPENKKYFIIEKTLPSLMKAYEKIKYCDFKICIYHGGIEFDPSTFEINSQTDENVGGKIVESMKLDLLLTAHQHMSFIDLKKEDTVLIQPGSYGTKAVELDIDIENKKINTRYINSSDSFDEDLFSEEYNIEKQTQLKLDESIATLPKALPFDTHLNMAINGSELANFVNEVQIDATGAKLSVVSFANEIMGLSKNVTMREVLNTYKFPNTLVVLEIDGKNLRRALENNYNYIKCVDNELIVNPSYEYPKKEHYNFDFFYGVDYEIDFYSPDKKIGNIYIDNKLVEDDSITTIVMNNYRATGIAGFDMYKDLKIVKEVNMEMSELIVEYLRKNYN